MDNKPIPKIRVYKVRLDDSKVFTVLNTTGATSEEFTRMMKNKFHRYKTVDIAVGNR